jgi:hypothetical protein
MGCVVAPVYPFILAEVPIKDAGSASGIVNTVQQIGGAVGVAVVGVIFFGLLASQAEQSVRSVEEALAADLSAAGLPASYQGPVVESFEQCFRDRAEAKDLAAIPESCKQAESQQASFAMQQPALAGKVGEVLKKHGLSANERNFTASMEHTLYWQMAALVVIFLLSFLLPAQPRSREEMEKLVAEGVVGIV